MKWLVLVCIVLALTSSPAWSAQASWSKRGGGLRVGGSGRAYTSHLLQPPDLVKTSRIAQVHWQYSLPPGRRLLAWLCAGSRCVRLHGRRGVSRALAGVSGGQALRFRFRLRPGDRKPVSIGSVQVIVDCR